ncbi:MAG: T9SS type A sorting domain-containing protein, partial [Flavobacteriaceae bacterium]|nr:T9SS type A sorting domain-containing protein [Flavobacteriaceae bacterium]
ISTHSLEDTRVVALNKSIGLYQLTNPTNYTLYSMTGQKILAGRASDNSHVIEASSIASGIYLIELEDADTKARLKKKIVL